MTSHPADLFIELLLKNDVRFASGVPDSLLAGFSGRLERHDDITHISAPNEGSALALALGHHLGTGRIPLVYLQNSGLGNLVNPLISLMSKEVFQVPALLVVGWRGETPETDEPQHRAQGPATIPMLDALGVKVHLLSQESSIEETVEQSIGFAREFMLPSAILISKGVLGGGATQPHKLSLFSRREAISIVYENIDESAIVVATTGKTAREAYEEQPPGQRERTFLTIGGMGHASSIALGLHEAVPNQDVICLDGDGAVQMHMGALAMIGYQRPSRFLHFIIDNGVHESVGGQSISNPKIEYPGLALACGYQSTTLVGTAPALRTAISEVKGKPGPHMIVIKVDASSDERLGRPSGFPSEWKAIFMESIANDATREIHEH
jgi:phosphonopyruvate decarboxylase